MAKTYINPNAIKSNSLDFNILMGGGDLLSRIEKIEQYLNPPALGDIAYWDGNKVKVIAPYNWDDSLGTPVGVVVIPEGFAPDGKARFVALQDASASTVTWGNYGTDTSLTNYNSAPTTDNAGSTTTGSNKSAFLPSDDTVNFTGATSYVDPKTKYYGLNPYTLSPYLADGSLNPAYCEAISGYNNALSDFNGKSNTDVLVGLGTAYTAANAAKNYAVDGVDIDWYLPAEGELGFLVPRFAAINESIAVAGGVAVPTGGFWSSSEYSSNYAYYVSTSYGHVDYAKKTSSQYVRSFAVLERHRPTIISFRIEDETYYYEQGMTWGEWCNSKYNINNTYTTDSYGQVVIPGPKLIVCFQYCPVKKVDTITNTKYKLLTSGSTD